MSVFGKRIVELVDREKFFIVKIISVYVILIAAYFIKNKATDESMKDDFVVYSEGKFFKLWDLKKTSSIEKKDKINTVNFIKE